MKTALLILLVHFLLGLSFCVAPGPQNTEVAQSAKLDTMLHKYTNSLINETSPYLVQHAHNPVDWHAWNQETLAKAQKENKVLIISIGYSACHWCHVMEHESFEDEEVAKMMNDNFICIKIDREERPDIDQVYMNAVQLMNQRGGWPLNCFALPDGRPFFGGTYFPKHQWLQILQKVADEYEQNPNKVKEFAQKLTEGIKESDLITLNKSKPDFNAIDLDKLVESWSKRFDNKEGGANKAPKFPIPNNYQFLLRYAHFTENKEVLDHVKLTLNKMAFGGIYDHLGGGFARYSTDNLWKVPHFEKMLYDNAQLVTLYAEAYQKTKEPLYKDVVFGTLEFIKREMTDKVGAFYSALDADSEGEEGKFYVWEAEELKELLASDFAIFSDYYNINENGLWDGKYILLRQDSREKVAKAHKISINDLDERIEKAKNVLMKVRAKRIRPGLDDKSLTSWNALMLKAYLDAYNVFKEEEFLKIALKNAAFIETMLRREDGGLFHSYKEGRATINGFLEDYAFTCEAFISLYESTFDERWLEIAKELLDYSIAHFFDSSSGMFYFTSVLDPDLVARKMEIHDNVIPASNSSMAKSLFRLGHYYYDQSYNKISIQMLNNVKPHMITYPSGYSNWGMLILDNVSTFYEVAIVGKDADKKRMEFNDYYIPNKLYIGSNKESNLPLLQNKFVVGKTIIYVCVNKSCKLPVSEVADAVKLIE